MKMLEAWKPSGWVWLAPLLALLMLVLMLIPADFWDEPQNDAVYEGFDPNLLYVSEKSYPLPEAGKVEVSTQSLKLTAPNQNRERNFLSHDTQ